MLITMIFSSAVTLSSLVILTLEDDYTDYEIDFMIYFMSIFTPIFFTSFFFGWI